MTENFDLHKLNAGFHIKSILPRFFLRCPLGVPDWGREQRRIFSAAMFSPDESDSADRKQQLEKKLTSFLDVPFCKVTASGRDAIKLALLSLELKPGDEVVIPDFTCLSVLLPVLQLGLQPVLADTATNLQIDPESVNRVITSKTKVVIVPHLFGGLADIGQLVDVGCRKGIYIIDDAAQIFAHQAPGGYAGCAGDVGIYSFGLFKPAGSCGGGALVTVNDNVYDKACYFMENSETVEISRLGLMKCYAKILHRKYSYMLFLLYRYLQSKTDQKPTVFSNFNSDLHDISLFECSLTDSMLGKSKMLWEQLQPKAEIFHHQLEQFNFLRNCIPMPYFGAPRWAVEIVSENPAFLYVRLFSFLLSKGIEVQPSYTPLHKFLHKHGMPVKGEYKISGAMYNRIMCLPFSIDIDSDYIISCLTEFSVELKR